MKRRHLGFGLVVLGLLVTGSVPALSERGDRRCEAGKQEAEIHSSLRVPPSQSMLARLAVVKVEEAIAAAKGAANGIVIAAELENENGGLVWSVEIAGDTQVMEVVIDAGNTKVLAVEVDEDDDDDDEEGENSDEDDDDEEGEARPWRSRR